MRSYRSISPNLSTLLDMLKKGELLSRKQAAESFSCSESTITRWLNYLRGRGHKIEYSTAKQKFLLIKRKRRKKREEAK